MEQVLRFGVVGVGNMGCSHVLYLNEGKVVGATITAACDIKQDRLDWVRDEVNPDIKLYTDYKEMIDSGEIDAIIIATPHYLHPVIGIYAFEKGLHVMSEKPIGVYTKHAKDFIDAAKKSGKVFGLMFNCRPEPYYKKIREMVKGGELGDIKRSIWIITNWYRTQDYYNSGGWRATYSGEGGGVLINQCPHQLDLWQWIMGMPTRVRAFASFGKYHDIEVEDEVTAYTEYADGSTGVFITTTGEYPGTNRLEITGTKGKLVYEFGKLTFYRLGMDEREYCFKADDSFGALECTEEEVIATGFTKGHRTVTQNFVDHILHGTELLAPGEEGINSLTLSNAMILSQWTDNWVDIPNDGEEYWEILQDRIANSKEKKVVNEKVSDLSNTFNMK